MNPADWSRIDAALSEVCAHGLRTQRVIDLSVDEADALRAAAIAARVQGLLAAAVDQGVIVVSGADAQSRDAWTCRVRDDVYAAARTALVAEAAAVEVCRSLADEHIENRVLKGIATAHLDEDDPSLRMFGDADILIHPDSLAAAVHCLGCLGYRRVAPPVRKAWELRYGKSVVVRNGQREIDLHLRLASGFFGHRPAVSELWAEPPDTIRLGGHRLSALGPSGRLRHAAIHASVSSGARWRAHRDVALLTLRGDSWGRLRDQPGAAVLAAAIAETWMLLGLDEHPARQWASGYTSTRVERRALAATSFRRTAFAALPALGPVAKVGLLAGLAMPSRDFRRHRNAGGEL